MKPTEAQIKEFWEWCGLEILEQTWVEDHYEPDGRWYDSAGRLFEGNYLYGLPDIDPNNLFKYAVPVAIDRIMAEQECSSDVAYAILFKKWLQKLELDIPNHEGTLFWTIWEVFHE